MAIFYSSTHWMARIGGDIFFRMSNLSLCRLSFSHHLADTAQQVFRSAAKDKEIS
jgi:hypothetical protein